MVNKSGKNRENS